MTGAIPRTPSRLPEDVTALAEREMGMKDGKESKNAVSKTYHTLKDLISSKFKKDSSEMTQEELNNVTIQTQQQIQNFQNDEIGQSYYAIMQQHHLQQQQQQASWHSQNMTQQMWNANANRPPPIPRDSPNQQIDMNGQMNYSNVVATRASIHQHRAASQPQLNMQFKEQSEDRRGSLANIDVTDSDDGGFVAKQWRANGNGNSQQPQPRMMHTDNPSQQIIHQQQQNYLKRSTLAQQSQSQQILSNGNSSQYQSQMQPSAFHLHQQMMQAPNSSIPDGVYMTQKVDLTKNGDSISGNGTNSQEWNGLMRNQEMVRTSFQQDQPALNQKGEKQVPPIPPAKPPQHQPKKAPNYEPPPKPDSKKPLETSTPNNSHTSTQLTQDQSKESKQVPGSAASSDYDKSGNHSSNVDSGRGSAAYSSGRKATLDTSPDHSDTPIPQARPKSTGNDSEWIDIVDAELRHILEPGLQNLTLRTESTISGSISSMSPPLPPLSPDGSVLCTNTTSNNHTNSSTTITNKANPTKSMTQVNDLLEFYFCKALINKSILFLDFQETRIWNRQLQPARKK